MFGRTTHSLLALLATTAMVACSGGEGGAYSPSPTDAPSTPAKPAAEVDLDGDGIIGKDDLCPGSRSATDALGCDAEQRAAGVGAGLFTERTPTGEDPAKTDPNAPGRTPEQIAQELLADPPATGEVTNEMFAITVDAGNAPTPMVFHTHESNVTVDAGGLHVDGNLVLATPLGHIGIAEGHLYFELGADGVSIERISGRGALPFPAVGFLENFEAEDLIEVEFGFDLGSNLAQLEAPLKDDRKYLYFNFSAGLELSTGPLTLSAPGGEDALIVLDPSDPMFFVKGSLLGLGAIGPIEDVGIGLSLQGYLPYAPETFLTAATAQQLEFDGHLYLEGSVPLTRLPMTVDGQLVIDLAPNGTIPRFDSPELRYGSNGTLRFTADFLSVLSFEAYLGSSSTVISVTEERSDAFFAGTIAPDRSSFLEFMPIRTEESLQVEGLLSTELVSSYMMIVGNYNLSGPALTSRLGVSLDDLAVASATIRIDHNGAIMNGQIAANIEPYPGFAVGAGAVVQGYFADDPNNWYIDITGNMSAGGYELFEASARIDRFGVLITGKVDLGAGRFTMTGRIDQSGFELTGEALVSIPVSAGREVVSLVTDAAICGYNVVTDGAICGYNVVTDGAVCGFETVTSGAVCGYETVTSAAICGTDTIRDGAICGYNWVTSGAECGWNTVVSEICSQDWLSWFCEDVINYTPRSCNVAASCSVPRTCTDWNTPRTCTDWSLPRTCEDVSSPKTCEDVQSPATCEHHEIIPDYHFGDFNGRVYLSLSNTGLTGEVSGEYCLSSGGCETLLGGSLRIGDPTRACIDIPGGLGEFCSSL